VEAGDVHHTILFDLDGTLTDPFEGITRSIRHALVALGVDAPAQPELRWCIGPPLRVSLPRLLGTDDAARVEAAVAAYRDRYGTVGLFENVRYEGVPEMLRALRDEGRRLFVATSKPRVVAERIVAHFELAPHFEPVYGAELDGRFDHKDALIAHLLDTEQLAPERVLMVGDREHDVLGARANRIRALGVTYGYGSLTELVEAGAAATVDGPGEVVGAVRALDARAFSAS
jgi:phosphoglycolate phosphatase